MHFQRLIVCWLIVMVSFSARAQEAYPSTTIAKEAYGRQKSPSPLKTEAIGNYAKGCLAGGQGLKLDGPNWQIMRPSRNRMWGHPDLIAFLKKFSSQVPAINRWPGLLIGDIAQPRGGPMLTGHASHQIGLDADIWLTPMPERRLSTEERENLPATNLVNATWDDVDPLTFTPQHSALLKAAALAPQIERIFVNPAIKKALCRDTKDDRSWLSKIRPMYGHNYHFHIRFACIKGETACLPQEPPSRGEGCGSELDWWFTDEAKKPTPPRPPITLAQMPAKCDRVLKAR